MPKRVPPLSSAKISKLRPDSAKTIELVDGAVPGLRLRITPNGTRTWSLNIRAKGVMRRFDVGRGLGLSDARKQAEEMRQRIRIGADPTAEKRAARQQAQAAKQGRGTLGSVIKSYFQSGPGNLLASQDEQVRRVKSVFRSHLNRPALEITSAELQLAIDGHTAKTSAARAASYLAPILKWAEKRGFVQGPFDLEKPVRRPTKQRVLDASDLKKVLPFFTDPYGRCCLFILLTGARLDEAKSATWKEIDFEAGTWAISGERRKDTRPNRARTQSQHSHIVPLSRQALLLLQTTRETELARRQMAGNNSVIRDADLVFVGARGGKLANWDRWLKATAKKSSVKNWSAHALRRTTATLAGDLGAPPHVVSAILGHANIGGQLVAGYNKSRYLTEQSETLQKVADFIDKITAASSRTKTDSDR
ncbi:tyrosine-type recombinase/integrase [Altererythrobacter sp. GH1-8]|uniref:tyrosine-type recombinase/integrase n=1 Tax=Altererythrobacter sp. GH1-8 TaxID=3349333 RepID=UPI00374D0F59